MSSYVAINKTSEGLIPCNETIISYQKLIVFSLNYKLRLQLQLQVNLFH